MSRGHSSGGTRPTAGRDTDVLKIHGLHAVRAVLAHRPEAVVRAYFDDARKGELGALMRSLADRRIAYRLVPTDELDRVAQSRHHEGVCILAKPRPQPTLQTWIEQCPAAACALVLDGVVNPHNLGAIVRTSAHFGVRGIWVVGQVALHGALARVAEGGVEAVDVWSIPTSTPVLLELRRAGFQVIGTSGREAGSSLHEHRFARRTALVLGSERAGLSAVAEAEVEMTLAIPGTGAVESLNVASAAAVFLSEYARQRHGKRG